MKKLVIIILMGLFLISVKAKNEEPQYKIIAHSYQEEDIKEMYKIKNG